MERMASVLFIVNSIILHESNIWVHIQLDTFLLQTLSVYPHHPTCMSAAASVMEYNRSADVLSSGVKPAGAVCVYTSMGAGKGAQDICSDMDHAILEAPFSQLVQQQGHAVSCEASCFPGSSRHCLCRCRAAASVRAMCNTLLCSCF